MATSQNGWPALSSDSSQLHLWSVPAGKHDSGVRKLKIRNGSAGFLLTHLVLWFDDVIEDVEGGPLDDWGHAYRAVRGYDSTLSNHASGTAVDLNAPRHWLGAENTFSVEKERLILRRVNGFFDGAIRWGGEYSGRKDEMHFEIDCSLKYAEQIARDLLDTPRGRLILEANRGQKAVILS